MQIEGSSQKVVTHPINDAIEQHLGGSSWIIDKVTSCQGGMLDISVNIEIYQDGIKSIQIKLDKITRSHNWSLVKVTRVNLVDHTTGQGISANSIA